MNKADDEKWMKHALELAARGRGHTRPNPCVGAVIVSPAGDVIGEGWHTKAGMAHAEVAAFTDARLRGADSRGATMYVTLEPCSHTGRTPPCTEAVMRGGIARLVAATRDPNRQAAGGLEVLASAGIKVDSGVCEAEARLLNAEFLTYHTLKRPLVTLKWAMTMDGCTSLENGESRWITGDAARAEVHRRRAANDAVLAGIGTVLRDSARLSARTPESTFRPMRIVLDSQLWLQTDSAFATERDGSRAIVVCTENAEAANEHQLTDAGLEVWRLPSDDSLKISVTALLSRLYDEKIQSLYIEGGRSVGGSFLEASVIDRVECWIAPKIIGGGKASLGPILRANPLTSMGDIIELHHTSVTNIGSDFLLEGWITNHIVSS